MRFPLVHCRMMSRHKFYKEFDCESRCSCKDTPLEHCSEVRYSRQEYRKQIGVSQA